MPISYELAKRIIGIRYEELPCEAIRQAKRAILDTLGVALAGSGEPAVTLLRKVLGEESTAGHSVVFGSQQRTGSLGAALINGTAAHALDFDDVSDAMGGHPSAPVLAALLALADRIDADGKQVLNAFIAGFETEVRIAKAVNFHHYKKGWHPTATLGIFGASAACARLLELDELKIATALSLSTSLAAGLKSNFGTMTKSLHVGNIARAGLLSALLASQGFTAGPDAFEHKQGFLNVFNGEGTYVQGKMFDSWANPLEIVDPGVVIKQYPCCASTHSAIDTLIALARDNHIAADQVAKIEVWIHERRLEHTNRPDPQTSTAAKFSLQYCLARALMHKNVVLEHFEGQAFLEPRARAILQKVKAAPYSTEQFGAENDYGAEIKLTLCDGQIYLGKLDESLGASDRHPLPTGALQAKFENCAGRILPFEQIRELQNTVERLENLSNVRELTALTIPRAKNTSTNSKDT
jgi:2-methylcitrate dehydratase PrpD